MNTNNWKQVLYLGGNKENMRKAGLAKDLLNNGRITKEELDQLRAIDPSPNKKYVNWMAKIYVNEKPDLTSLKNAIEEYYTLEFRRRIKSVDIFSFKTFSDFQNFVAETNDQASATLSEAESDYEVIRDDSDVYIVVPYTHEASRKLGLSMFHNRGSDCVWCTTYKNNSHFNSYYYSNDITFYYILVRNTNLLKKLPRGYDFTTVAISVFRNNKVVGNDGHNNDIPSATLKAFMRAIGI
jgi:hypothetical protein